MDGRGTGGARVLASQGKQGRRGSAPEIDHGGGRRRCSAAPQPCKRIRSGRGLAVQSAQGSAEQPRGSKPASEPAKALRRRRDDGGSWRWPGHK
eukprot:scaffold27711_cov124-Isochrysis_galbana.AAC.1